MSEPGSVTLATHEGISAIRFSHEKANCFPLQLLQQLGKAIRAASQDSSSNIILVSSSGDGAFSAGASFDEFKRITSTEEAEEFFWGFADVMLAMRESSKPIVTRVQGKVVGGGLGIVACSDYVIAHSSAAIRLSEIGLGIGPFTIGVAVERRIGNGRFSSLVLDAEWRTAEWAEQAGLYSQICTSIDELNIAVDAVSQHLLSVNPETLRQNRMMLWSGTSNWEAILKERVAVVADLLLRNDDGS